MALRAGQFLTAFCPDHNRTALSAFLLFFYNGNVCGLLFIKLAFYRSQAYAAAARTVKQFLLFVPKIKGRRLGEDEWRRCQHFLSGIG